MPLSSKDISTPVAGSLLFLLALLPFTSVLVQSGSVVSIEYSEFPVKMWCYLRFWEHDRFFGGRITEAGFPDASYLNNPDIVATLFIGIFKPILGHFVSFNLLLFSVMLLNLSSLYFLARQFLSSRIASIAGAVAFGWNSLLLSYGFSSNITDLIHVWPYAFSIAWLLIGLKQESNRAGWIAGLFLGLGFLTCPYNFILFLPSLLLLLPWIVWRF